MSKNSKLMKEKRYSVFVGGVEVNDYLVTLKEANKIALLWLEKGYDDVGIVKYTKKDLEKNKSFAQS